MIHYGVPPRMDEYVQETGRVGRDGLPSQAIILYHPNSLLGPLISEDMKTLVTTDACRRKVILAKFDAVPESPSNHTCCDNCCSAMQCCSCAMSIMCTHQGSSCMCVKWCTVMTPLEVTGGKSNDESRPVREIDSRDQLVDMLWRLKVSNIHMPHNIQNIYPDLVQKISSNAEYVLSYKDVLEAGAMSLDDAQSIMKAIDLCSKGIEGGPEQ